MASVNVRKRGEKWEYRFEAAKVDGKRRHISKSGFRTKKEALEAGNKALVEYNNGGSAVRPSDMSLSDFLDSYLDMHPLSGNFDLAHLCQIHHFMFCDLYEWAGQLRTVDLSKKGTAFVAANRIEECANACFARISSMDFSAMSHDELVEELADFYSTLNMIHPFREGNGRVQRVFFTQWLRHLGYDIDFSCVDADVFIIATIRAAQGVMDDLKTFFAEELKPL